MIELTEAERKSLKKYIAYMETELEQDGQRINLYLRGKTQEACEKIFK